MGRTLKEHTTVHVKYMCFFYTIEWDNGYSDIKSSSLSEITCKDPSVYIPNLDLGIRKFTIED